MSTLALQIALSVLGNYNGPQGLVASSGIVDIVAAVALANGTGAGQADLLLSVSSTLGAGEDLNFTLANGLTDLYGQDLEFSAVKLLFVYADPGNTTNLIVGGGTWAGPFAAAGQSVEVPPGQVLLLVCQDPSGYPVASGSDGLQISSSAQAVYSLLVAGVSTAISAPGCTVFPFLPSTPTLAIPLAVNTGQWSGSPTFTYQWTRGGSAISGATSAIYTPVSGDVGHGVSCVVTATNPAGSVTLKAPAITAVA